VAFDWPAIPLKTATKFGARVTEPAEIIEEALSIEVPSSAQLMLDDTRRLTGPGMLWHRPGAVLDILYTGFDTGKIVEVWRVEAHRVLVAIGWGDEHLIERPFDGGISLALSAPLDQLYSATFAAQTIWHFCAGELLGAATGDFSTMIEELKSVMSREANPMLIALVEAAKERDVEALVDDDFLSVGHGVTSLVWPVLGLPSPDEVNWKSVSNIPVALITGTNGKTTSTRLVNAIAQAAGRVAGLTSTDMVSVGTDILDRGDYSGPGGARMLLRDKRVEMGFLEVARGGILRRGLPVLSARAALVTNVAADHLGQFGVNTVEELAVVKMAVHQSLADDGVLILNADDPLVVQQAVKTPATIWWFSVHEASDQIISARSNGISCGWLEGTALKFFDGTNTIPVIDVNEVPITMSGAAQYNVLNTLGAICLSHAMGLDLAAIRAGLSGFQNDPKDNPGRCNEFDVNGARVFVDFAHNPHSIQAVIEAMRVIPAKRRFVMLSHAGDRSNQDILDVTASALAMNPDFVVATELPEHIRGREVGEVSALIGQECKARGLKSEQILMASSPADGAKQILERLHSGDLALLLVLSERDQVFEMLGN